MRIYDQKILVIMDFRDLMEIGAIGISYNVETSTTMVAPCWFRRRWRGGSGKKTLKRDIVARRRWWWRCRNPRRSRRNRTSTWIWSLASGGNGAAEGADIAGNGGSGGKPKVVSFRWRCVRWRRRIFCYRWRGKWWSGWWRI